MKAIVATAALLLVSIHLGEACRYCVPEGQCAIQEEIKICNRNEIHCDSTIESIFTTDGPEQPDVNPESSASEEESDATNDCVPIKQCLVAKNVCKVNEVCCAQQTVPVTYWPHKQMKDWIWD